jgi:hypothetical protein
MTFGIWEIAADAARAPPPAGGGVNVVESGIAFTIEGEEHIVGSGSAVVVLPNARHSATPRRRCRAIVVDWPLRHALPGLTDSQ